MKQLKKNKTFDVICVDIPWKFSDGLKHSDTKRGAEANYNTLSVEELCELPIQQLSDPSGSILALWSVGSMLNDALKIIEAWGYKQKQVFVWVKSKKDPFTNKTQKDLNNVLAFGMGRLFRQTHEICLIATNNNGIYKKLKNRSQRSVCFEVNEGHSIKPELLQNRLEIMFPHAIKNGTALELFARRERNGWLCLGNEVGDREDIRIALDNLLNENIAVK